MSHASFLPISFLIYNFFDNTQFHYLRSISKQTKTHIWYNIILKFLQISEGSVLLVYFLGICCWGKHLHKIKMGTTLSLTYLLITETKTSTINNSCTLDRYTLQRGTFNKEHHWQERRKLHSESLKTCITTGSTQQLRQPYFWDRICGWQSLTVSENYSTHYCTELYFNNKNNKLNCTYRRTAVSTTYINTAPP